MAVASLESGHSTEVISFKGDNFGEVSIKLYPCNLTINTLGKAAKKRFLLGPCPKL